MASSGRSRPSPPPEKGFADAINEQISNEFAASQQYIGAAVYYDSETLPRLAAFFYRQAVEERNHAMIMVQFLLDIDEPVVGVDFHFDHRRGVGVSRRRPDAGATIAAGRARWAGIFGTIATDGILAPTVGERIRLPQPYRRFGR